MRRVLLLLGLLLLSVPFVFAQGIVQRGTTSVGFVPNETSTGTTQYRLAKIVAGKAIRALTTDTAVPLFIVVSATATTGDAVYVVAGPTVCEMDAINASGVSGWPVVASVTTAGKCHVQAAMPTAGYAIGYMGDDSTSTAAGALAKINALNQPNFPSAGAGITSLTLVEPAEFTVTGSPLTGPGTLTVIKATQTANTVWAGPTSGGAAAPAFRALVAADVPAAPPGGACGGDTGGSYPNCTVLKASAQFALAGEIRPTALSGNVNDYAPTGAATSAIWYIDGGAADRSVTGILAGGDGELKLLNNVGATYALLLPSQSTASTASNRFQFGGDTRLFPGESLMMIYDSTAARWKPFGPMVLDAYRIRLFTFSLGSPSASSAPIQADDGLPDSFTNDYARDIEILTVACKTNNTGLVMTPILQGGSPTSLVTGPLTCGAGTWNAATLQTPPPIVHSFSGTGATCAVAPCALDVSWTTTGLATYATVKIAARIR